MKKLNLQQVEILYRHLVRNGTNDVLLDELLDHLACEVEYHMWIGLSFETALDKVLSEANDEAVRHLREVYKVELAMTDEQLRQASLDDIVFEFRNKAYGAYDLRQEYRKTLLTALIMGVGMVMMLIALLSGFSQGKWSYLSIWGLIWILGLGLVTYAVGRWFHQRIQQKYQIAK